MANYSIPNSIPAIGRISTPLSQRSRKQNSASTSFFAGQSLTKRIQTRTSSFFNAQRSTSNAQRAIRTVGRWMLGVGRSAFSLWRVKGAWWSSRSSKPLSVPHTRDRGRFDSYPLRRLFNAQRSTPNAQRSLQIIEHWVLDVRRWTFSLRLNHSGLPIADCRTLPIARFPIRGPHSKGGEWYVA
jgi:hypothetical protein